MFLFNMVPWKDQEESVEVRGNQFSVQNGMDLLGKYQVPGAVQH